MKPLKRKTVGDYMIMRSNRYFTGYSFSKRRDLAARYITIDAAAAVANKIAMETNTSVKVVLAARHVK